MISGEQTQSGPEYPEWKPSDWTLRQRIIALISLMFLALSCALIALSLAAWGTGPLAVETFVPIGITLLTVSATLLTSVSWYARHHAANVTSEGPDLLYSALVLIGIIALVTLVFQVVGGVLVATVGWEAWREYSAVSYDGPAALAGLAIFLLAAHNGNSRPTRDPSVPKNRLTAPVSGARLLFRWALMLLARNSWLIIWGALLFGVGISKKVIDGLHVDTREPVAIFWCVAAFFCVAVVIELLPRRPLQGTIS